MDNLPLNFQLSLRLAPSKLLKFVLFIFHILSHGQSNLYFGESEIFHTHRHAMRLCGWSMLIIIPGNFVCFLVGVC